MPDLTTKDVLIVGVDESAPGDAALRYALEEAGRRDATLRVVIACRPPEMAAYSYAIYQISNPEQNRTAAAAAVGRRVEEIRSSLPAAAAVQVEVVAESGSPVSVLVEAARDAALLVVGHRGRGGLRSALLGSVGLGVVLNAPCPVTVVPAPVLDGVPDGVSRSVYEAPPLPLPVGPIA